MKNKKVLRAVSMLVSVLFILALLPSNVLAATYVVKHGDSLSKIASLYGLTWEELWKLNTQIRNPHLIYVGESLFVPDSDTHIPAQQTNQTNNGNNNISTIQNSNAEQNSDAEQNSAAEQNEALSLPAPTGQYIVGTTEIHLVDNARIDEWTQSSPREIMISLWYPAEKESDVKAPYMLPGAAQIYEIKTLSGLPIPLGIIDWCGIGTNAWQDADVANSESGWPVILYTPGLLEPRSLGTVLVSELASHGYIVITIDHTYETKAVEFPDNRIAESMYPEQTTGESILKAYDIRLKDVKYVLDMLELVQKGENPDFSQKSLPVGFAQNLDLTKTGMFGHSMGGGMAAHAMYNDERIDAGINMDGTFGHMPDHLLPVARNGVDRPFMLMNAGYNRDGEVDSHVMTADRNMFWEASSGWKKDIAIPNAMHFVYTDQQALVPLFADSLGLSTEVIHSLIGTADAQQVLDAQRELVRAFFDQHLKAIPQEILNGNPSPYKDVYFMK